MHNAQQQLAQLCSELVARQSYISPGCHIDHQEELDVLSAEYKKVEWGSGFPQSFGVANLQAVRDPFGKARVQLPTSIVCF